MSKFLQMGDVYLDVDRIVSIRQNRKDRTVQFIISDGKQVYPLVYTNKEADAVFHWLDEVADVYRIY